MKIIIGTSGWQYSSWKQPFYGGSPQRLWLEQYAGAYQTVEVNNAFYRLPDAETFKAWHDRTPDDFIFAIKASRFLTHIKRLADPEEPVERLLTHMEPLAEKLGPVLLQLPPTLQVNPDRLDRTLGLFVGRTNTAVEFRHDSWFTNEVQEVLRKHNSALCLADKLNHITPLWETAPFTYVRFHAGRANPNPCYGKAALQTWVDRLSEMSRARTAYVYFNNDPNACAVRNAEEFATLAAKAGHKCTRASREAKALADIH